MKYVKCYIILRTTYKTEFNMSPNGNTIHCTVNKLIEPKTLKDPDSIIKNTYNFLYIFK